MTAHGEVSEVPKNRIILNDEDVATTPNRLKVGGDEVPGYTLVEKAYPLTLADAMLDAHGNRVGVSENSVDELYVSKCLERFSHKHTAEVLRHWASVLKPGGILKLSVPDLDRCIAARAEGIPVPFEESLMGTHENEDATHGALFDEPSTVAQLRDAGLRNIRRWRSGDPVSLDLQATKRSPVDYENTFAVMSVPRLGFMDHFRCAVELFQAMKIPLICIGGAFWDKALTIGMEDALNRGAKYILTLDYDTLFDWQQVDELLWLLQNNDHDAVCPAQVQRGKNRMLVNLMGPDGGPMSNPTVGDLDGELHPLCSGHFGLTCIKAEALKRTPRPWFFHQHDKFGGFSLESKDADIVFWERFRGAGGKIGMACHVAVAHAQMVATYPDQAFRPIHTPIEDWRKVSAPANVRR